jgi:chromate reductase, NAD(P)H dehydrogenase (quinone)
LACFVERAVSILLISGSLRQGSTNTAALRTVVRDAPSGVAPELYDGLARLPAFNPDDDHDPLPPPVAGLRAALHQADALVFSVPEYAGALPGSLKNLLDWLIGDADQRSINGKPVAWINVSARGAQHAHDALRRILGYAGAAVIESACVDVPVSHDALDSAALIVEDDAIRRVLARAVAHLVAGIDAKEPTAD